MGKTTLALQIALHVAREAPVVYVCCVRAPTEGRRGQGITSPATRPACPQEPLRRMNQAEIEPQVLPAGELVGGRLYRPSPRPRSRTPSTAQMAA